MTRSTSKFRLGDQLRRIRLNQENSFLFSSPAMLKSFPMAAFDSSYFPPAWTAFALAFSIFIAVRSLRKSSLNKSGALAACLVGLVTIGSHIIFGVILLTFFLSSSRITKLGSRAKAAVYADYKPGGQRNAAQVLANGAWAVLACLAWTAVVGFSHALTWPVLSAADSTATAAGAVLLAFLALQAVVAHFAACCGDTWASELGSAFGPARPRLVLPPFRTVPAGTNGAVSLVGSAASAAGGLLVGLVAAAAMLLVPFTPVNSASAVVATVTASATNACATASEIMGAALVSWCHALGLVAAPAGAAGAVSLTAARLPLALACVATGLLAGTVGSVVDSIAGAVLQLSAVTKDGRVVDDRAAAVAVAAGAPKAASVERVSGWHVLNNNQVNVLSAFVVTVGAVLAWGLAIVSFSASASASAPVFTAFESISMFASAETVGAVVGVVAGALVLVMVLLKD